MPENRQELWIAELGIVDYEEALTLQRRIHTARADGLLPDVLLLLEHPPVYTRGRSSRDDELPMGEEWYKAQGIPVRSVDRGGRVTYHGPGQLVGYPIISTAHFDHDVKRLVGSIEDTVISALSAEGVNARPDPAGRGVWVGDAKIASIGLHLARHVTTHGFMVNVNNDLEPFTWIKPCGLADPVTSLSILTEDPKRMRCFRRRVAHNFANSIGAKQRLISPARIEQKLTEAERDLVSAA